MEQANQDPHCQKLHIKQYILTNFSGTVAGSDNENAGQTDPVEQSDQDSHCQEVSNEAIDQLG